jgi:hypothetical protein
MSVRHHMEERRYVTLEPDSTDRRRATIRGTDRGLAMLQEEETIFDEPREQWKQQVGTASLSWLEETLRELLNDKTIRLDSPARHRVSQAIRPRERSFASGPPLTSRRACRRENGGDDRTVIGPRRPPTELAGFQVLGLGLAGVVRTAAAAASVTRVGPQLAPFAVQPPRDRRRNLFSRARIRARAVDARADQRSVQLVRARVARGAAFAGAARPFPDAPEGALATESAALAAVR